MCIRARLPKFVSEDLLCPEASNDRGSHMPLFQFISVPTINSPFPQITRALACMPPHSHLLVAPAWRRAGGDPWGVSPSHRANMPMASQNRCAQPGGPAPTWQSAAHPHLHGPPSSLPLPPAVKLSVVWQLMRMRGCGRTEDGGRGTSTKQSPFQHRDDGPHSKSSRE